MALHHKRKETLSLTIENADLKIPANYFLEIINELFENAIIFSPKHTTIRVVGGVDDGQYTLTIRDEGMGMTTDQISRIGAFQKFNQDLNDNSGMGLGLVNAKNILALFNGSLLIKSSLGLETTVRISIPLA